MFPPPSGFRSSTTVASRMRELRYAGTVSGSEEVPGVSCNSRVWSRMCIRWRIFSGMRNPLLYHKILRVTHYARVARLNGTARFHMGHRSASVNSDTRTLEAREKDTPTHICVRGHIRYAIRSRPSTPSTPSARCARETNPSPTRGVAQ